jgi:ribokinase
MACALPVSTVVVTLGAQGALLVRDGDALHIPAPSVKVVDTTGAGDAFCGALAAGLARGISIEEAMLQAVHAGAISTTRLGAQPSLPTAAEVNALMDET